MICHLRKDDRPSKRGFTLLEMLVVVGIIALLLALFVPSLRLSRESARRMACSNQVKHIGLAMHNYHSAFDQLPIGMGGTDGGATAQLSNGHRLSGLVALMPFLEQQQLWEQISAPMSTASFSYPAMGPSPWIADYEPWATQVATLRCPSSSSTKTEFGETNYALCIGDAAREIHQPPGTRGLFACRITTRFGDVSDGLANTIAMGEIGTCFERRLKGQFALDQPASILEDPASCLAIRDSGQPTRYAAEVRLGDRGRGGCWADGAAGCGLFQTILPPNSVNAAVGSTPASDGIYSAGSWHQGGSHVLMADGAVLFITDSIEAGDASAATPPSSLFSSVGEKSPYGLWGALGTISGAEEVEQ